MKKIDKIIKESINKILVEKNILRNVDSINVTDECLKAERNVKGAINVWRKIGQYDNMRGQASSMWSNVMNLLVQAQKNIDRYYHESSEGYYEFGVPQKMEYPITGKL